MKIICAWCNREMGNEDGNDEMAYSVCRDCLSRFRIFPGSDPETTENDTDGE